MKTRAAICNSLAWTDLMMGAQRLGDEIAKSSAEAYFLPPWNASVQSTRGLALVDLGDCAGGLPLLRQSLRRLQSDGSERSVVLCSLANAAHRMGRARAAKRLLRRARGAFSNGESVPKPNWPTRRPLRQSRRIFPYSER